MYFFPLVLETGSQGTTTTTTRHESFGHVTKINKIVFNQ
jgi:hypothetical protein